MTIKEAIANLNHIYGFVSSDIQRSLDLAIEALEERPQAEWIEGAYLSLKCSNCEEEALEDNDYPYKSNYCPNCGAFMKGGANK